MKIGENTSGAHYFLQNVHKNKVGEKLKIHAENWKKLPSKSYTLHIFFGKIHTYVCIIIYCLVILLFNFFNDWKTFNPT